MENKVTATKMGEQIQIQQVMMKDPKKVEKGKRLAEWNHRKREELAQLKSKSKQVEPKPTYYGAGAIVAIGALGILGYYIYQVLTLKVTLVYQPKETLVYQPGKLWFTNLGNSGLPT